MKKKKLTIEEEVKERMKRIDNLPPSKRKEFEEMEKLMGECIIPMEGCDSKPFTNMEIREMLIKSFVVGERFSK